MTRRLLMRRPRTTAERRAAEADALRARAEAAEQRAEARLRGMRWWLAMVVVLGVTMTALAGCLRATNDMSRAVARWEVSDERD